MCTQIKGSNNKVKKNEEDDGDDDDTKVGCGYIVRRWKKNNLKMAIALSEIKRKYTVSFVHPFDRKFEQFFFAPSSALLPLTEKRERARVS